MRELFDVKGRPLYGQAEPLRLGRLADADVALYIGERFARTAERRRCPRRHCSRPRAVTLSGRCCSLIASGTRSRRERPPTRTSGRRALSRTMEPGRGRSSTRSGAASRRRAAGAAGSSALFPEAPYGARAARRVDLKKAAPTRGSLAPGEGRAGGGRGRRTVSSIRSSSSGSRDVQSGTPGRPLMHRSELTVDLGAVRRNARTLLRVLEGGQLWAVVKAERLRPRRGRRRRRGARRRARRRSASRPSPRRSSCAREFPLARILVLGPRPRAARSREAREARLELAVWDEEIPEGLPRAPEARHRHGPLGPLRAAEAVGRRGRPDDPPRHRRLRPDLRRASRSSASGRRPSLMPT